MTSTGLNRSQETVLSHQQVICPLATELHYVVYGR